MKILETFEKKIGQELPQSLKQFLAAPRELKYYSVPTVREFATLELLFPGVPPRALPFLSSSSGDMAVLYLPRDHAPLIGLYLLAEAVLLPLSRDIEGFLRNPDKYNPDGKRIRQDAATNWKELSYDFKSSQSELELLKPLAINSTYVAPSDHKQFARLAKLTPGSSAAAQIIRAHLTDINALTGASWWFSLADSLNKAGFKTEAIAALENSHTAHFIFGHEEECNHDHDHDHEHNCNAIWAHTLETYEKLAPLIKKHGDDLDRLTLKHQISLAQEMSAEPCEHDHGHHQHETPKNQLKKPIHIELNVRLADVVNADDDSLDEIYGKDEKGRKVKDLPLSKTTDTFLVQIGEPVGVSFELPQNASPGQALQRLAIWLEEDYLAAPAKYRTKGVKLEQVWVKGLEWAPGDLDWEVVFEVKR